MREQLALVALKHSLLLTWQVAANENNLCRVIHGWVLCSYWLLVLGYTPSRRCYTAGNCLKTSETARTSSEETTDRNSH